MAPTSLEEWIRAKGIGSTNARARARPTCPPREGALPVPQPQEAWNFRPEAGARALHEAASAWYATHLPKEATVLGCGDPQAQILLMGKAPAADECATGRPFSGRSGELLAHVLAPHALAPRPGGRIAFTNASLWFAPSGYNPAPGDIAAAEPYNRALLQTLQPTLILALGDVATRTLIGTERSVSSLRGNLHPCRDRWRLPGGPPIPVLVSWHPAFILRSPAHREDFQHDIARAARLLDAPAPNEAHA